MCPETYHADAGSEEWRLRTPRICATCKKRKPITAFESRPRRTRDPWSVNCTDCLKKIKQRSRRDAQYRRLYGIGLADYETILKRQQGRCAICRAQPPRNAHLHVDHDHATSKVRGLLCNNCNIAVGFMADDIDRCIAAARYLHEHRAE